MAIRTRDELMTTLKNLLDDSDESLGIIEDFTDTLSDYETKVGEDWKSKYEENDSAWRKRYHDRFFTIPVEVKEEQKEQVIDDGKLRSFDDLFKEREG